MKQANLLLKSILFLLTCTTTLIADSSFEAFLKHPNKYFIETGTGSGDGVQRALKAGFEQIYSIELAPHLYDHSRQRFENESNVVILFGNSTEVLPKILDYIDAPVTFWLDGHYSWHNTARGDTNTPVLQELEIIKQHPIKTHTILIDDVRQFGTVEFDFIEVDDIIAKLLEINPKYQISFEAGLIANDILVAEIP